MTLLFLRVSSEGFSLSLMHHATSTAAIWFLVSEPLQLQCPFSARYHNTNQGDGLCCLQKEWFVITQYNGNT